MNKEILRRFVKENIHISSSLGSLLNLVDIMYDIVLIIKPKVVVELGTDFGGSTITLLESCSESNGIVYSFDIVDCPIARNNVKKYELENNWIFQVSSSIEAAKRWGKDIKVDIVFVDTDHTYNTTLSEINAWFPLIRDGGVMMFHDTISRAKEVQKAIDDFLASSEIKYFYKNIGADFGDPYGLGVMIKVSKEKVNYGNYPYFKL